MKWFVDRFMPLLDMLQEIDFKLMNRIRENRERMLASEVQICPRIKTKLDHAIAQSRNWRATWDGLRTFVVCTLFTASLYLRSFNITKLFLCYLLQVRNGSKTLTVDLVDRKCDCRVFDLSGIPCAHVVAAIHNRREQPLDYVSKYYTREMYLESYKNYIAALRGDEFWESHSTEEMLPPHVPQKLRGRPKKQRRREEWDGGNRSMSESIVQRFPSGKKMKCSLCRQPGHRCTKCPKRATNTAEGDIMNEDVPDELPKQDAAKQPGVEKKNAPSRRPKLPVIRNVGIVIREPTVEQNKANAGDENAKSKKGKEKVEVQPKKKLRRPYLNLLSSQPSQASSTSNSGPTKKKSEFTSQDKGKSTTSQSHCLSGNKASKFMEELRGPLFNEWLQYSPVPGYVRWPPVIRPDEAIPTCGVESQSVMQEVEPEADQIEKEDELEQHEDDFEFEQDGDDDELEQDEEEVSEKDDKQAKQPTRRSVRLQSKHQFKFKNTLETAVVLDEDNEDNV